MKKFSVLWAALLLMAVLIACGSGKKEDQKSSGTKDGPAKLSVAIRENIRIENFETNEMTLFLEKEANVDLNFVLLPSTDYVNKLNLMVMAGGSELPDIIIGPIGDMMIYQWAREGVIIPLTKYYNDPALSPWIHESFERTGLNYLPQITSPDGEIYGFPTFNQAYFNECLHKFWYYEPWLKKLGLSVPATTDEFRNVLRTVVKQDANGNGKADEVGITGNFRFAGDEYGGWFNYLMNSFVYAGDNRFITLNNGVTSVAYNTPGWKEGLKYIRSLFAEGLIPVEILTQDRNQVNTLMNSEETRAFAVDYYSVDMITPTNPTSNEYIALPPLRGPGGQRFVTFRPSVASQSMVITANCKDPDAAFRVGDMLVRSDFSVITRRGKEGVDWDWAEKVKDIENYIPNIEGSPATIVVYDDNGWWGGSKAQNVSWRQEGPYVREYALSNGMYQPANIMTGYLENLNASAVLYQEGGWKPKEVVAKLVFATEDNEEISDLLTTLESYVTEMTTNFLAGNRDIDASWDAYLAELNVIGLPRAISIIQKTYDRQYK